MVDRRIFQPNEDQTSARGLAQQTLDGAGALYLQGRCLWLFLDYDGTLVPLVPKPREARPDAELLRTLARLGRAPRLRTAILSGRPLEWLQDALPISGLYLAGVYGSQIQSPDGGLFHRVDPEVTRRTVGQVKTIWEELIQGRSGFMIEDKGISVAMHSRQADREEAAAVEARAQAVAAERAGSELRVLSGVHYIELAPRAANKGEAVKWIIRRFPFQGALVVYVGDDIVDEEAFEVIQGLGGIAVRVGPQVNASLANERLPGVAEVRAWLVGLLEGSQADHG